MTKLLLVDDEVDLLAELQPLLERSGFEIATATDGEIALEMIKTIQPDLIILDVIMPKLNGREMLRQLRQADNWTPVILLTHVGTPTERAMSLQEGADDYINKPFDPFELVARINAIMRRVEKGSIPLASFQKFQCDDLTIDRQLRQAMLADIDLNLTARAFSVLEFLMLNAGEIIDRDRLLDEIWGWSHAITTRAVDIRISEIRKALQEQEVTREWIETVVGQGYRFLGTVKGVV